LQLPAEQIVFLSDIREELDAARQAGLQTVWLVRDQAIDSQAEHQQVNDFDAIQI
jgi:enolase-phosphatase E1